MSPLLLLGLNLGLLDASRVGAYTPTVVAVVVIVVVVGGAVVVAVGVVVAVFIVVRAAAVGPFYVVVVDDSRVGVFVRVVIPGRNFRLRNVVVVVGVIVVVPVLVSDVCVTACGPSCPPVRGARDGVVAVVVVIVVVVEVSIVGVVVVVVFLICSAVVAVVVLVVAFVGVVSVEVVGCLCSGLLLLLGWPHGVLVWPSLLFIRLLFMPLLLLLCVEFVMSPVQLVVMVFLLSISSLVMVTVRVSGAAREVGLL